jgi:hypothetical protein
LGLADLGHTHKSADLFFLAPGAVLFSVVAADAGDTPKKKKKKSD